MLHTVSQIENHKEDEFVHIYNNLLLVHIFCILILKKIKELVYKMYRFVNLLSKRNCRAIIIL